MSKKKNEGGHAAGSASPLRIVDVFCGAGGLSLGWLRAAGERGAELVAAVDADESLSDVFSTNFPNTRFLRHRFGDAFDADESEAIADRLGLQVGDSDVLLAGPPCQTFSAAGKRELGMESRLGYHICDLARLLQPKIVLIENVPEFSRAEEGRLLGRIRVRLSDAGYVTEVIHLNSVDYGVPQTRTRCFIVGLREDLPRLVRQDLLASLRVVPRPWELEHTTKDAPVQTTVREALSDLPSLSAGEGEQVSAHAEPAKNVYQTYLRGEQMCLFNHVAGQHSPELLTAMEMLMPGETPQDIEDHPLRRKDYFRAAYARLDPNKPSATMTTQTQNPGSGRFTHYRDHRVLTVREVARLQGFPDWFRFLGTQADQRRHVGNAVPPLLSETISSALLSLIDI